MNVSAQYALLVHLSSITGWVGSKQQNALANLHNTNFT